MPLVRFFPSIEQVKLVDYKLYKDKKKRRGHRPPVVATSGVA